MRHKQALGAHGEAIAARHLVQRGMVVLDRNWRCADGEIDLVLRDGQVAGRLRGQDPAPSTAFGTPLEAVTATKAARLRRLAAQWVAAHDLRGARCAHRPRRRRLPAGAPPTIDHVAGVG